MIRDLDAFATEYFAAMSAIGDTTTREERIAALKRPPGAPGQLDDLVSDKPTEAWRVILGLIDRAEDERALSLVGAGPLQDLIRERGGAFADRIIAEATANPRFREALDSTYG